MKMNLRDSINEVIIGKLRLAFVAAGVFFLPVNIYVLVGPIGSRAPFAPIYLFELFILLTVPLLGRQIKDIFFEAVPRHLRWAFGATWSLTLISMALNPSLAGAFHVGRLLVLGLFGATLVVLWKWRPQVVLLPLVAGCVLQAFLVLFQWRNGGPLGLVALGEGQSFIQFAGSVGLQGTFPHPYPLAGYCIVVICAIALSGCAFQKQSVVWLIAAALAAAPLGLTYSRMTILGLFALVGSLFGVSLIGGRRLLPLAMAVLLGFAVPAAMDPWGWIQRAQDSGSTLSEGNVDAFASGRATFMKEAVSLISSNVLAGVGPGLYLNELSERNYAVGGAVLFPVHTVPLLAAAEAGILVGLLVCWLLILLAKRAFQAGPIPMGCFLAFIPFVLLDHFPYTLPQGMATAALWSGLLVGTERALTLDGSPDEAG